MNHFTKCCSPHPKSHNPTLILLLTMASTSLVLAGNLAMSRQSPLCNYVCQCNFQTFSVNCTHLELTAVPEAIPVDIKLLSLASNKIRTIRSSDFSGVNQITKLILSFNEILFIQQGAFKDMYQLKYLNLYNNKLISIPSGIFQHLPSLERIDLRRNFIEEIKRDAFLFLPQIKQIRMEDNPLKCDCEVQSFIKLLDEFEMKNVYISTHCENTTSFDIEATSRPAFLTCNNKSIFAPNLACVTCADKKCHHKRVSRCYGTKAVCMNRVKMNVFTLESEKLCSTYSKCMKAESENIANCREWRNGTSCVSCCIKNRCNQNDFAGWTHTFDFELKFKMNKDFPANLLLPSSKEYRRLSTKVKLMLENELLNQNGAFSVIFLDFRLPQVTVHLKILCTVPIHIDELQVWQNILKILKMRPGLKPLKIQPNSIRLTGKMLCQSETTENDKGDFHWPTAKVGMEIQLPCLMNNQKASRKCIMRRGKRGLESESDESIEEPFTSDQAVWAKPNDSKCLTEDWFTDELQDLEHEEVDDDNIEIQSARLLNISKNADFFKQIDIELSVQIMQRIMPHISNVSTRLSTDNIFPILNNLMNTPERSLIRAEQSTLGANKLLEMVDDLSEEMQLESPEVSVSYSNLDVGILRTSVETFNGATFSMTQQNQMKTQKHSMVVSSGVLRIQDQDEISISLPGTLFDNLQEESSRRISRITFLLFKQDKLFTAIAKASKKTGTTTQDMNSVRRKNKQQLVQRIGSQVISASVPGVHLTRLKDPVTMKFLHLSKNATNPQCAFWQDSASITTPFWSTEGCRVLHSIKGISTVCGCVHLTSFALLMDIYENIESIDPEHKKALSMLSLIGCSISFVALLITIFTYLGFRKLRSGAVSHILVNLCITLATSNLIFVVGMQPYALAEIVACKIVAVLLHYTLLASMMWMAIEAVHIYLAMVVVFKTYLSHFIVRCSIFAWGVPLGIVALTLGINNTENYNLKGNICWLSQSAFYASFLFPISVVLIFNVSIFCIIIWRLLAVQKIKKYEHKKRKIRLFGIVGVFFLLGLTWTTAFLAIGEAGLVFSYLFTIFNSLQGLFIFIFYCLYKKESRENLTQLFRCFQKAEKSEKLNTKFSAEIVSPKKSNSIDIRSRKLYDTESRVNNSTENTNAGFTDDNNVITKL